MEKQTPKTSSAPNQRRHTRLVEVIKPFRGPGSKEYPKGAQLNLSAEAAAAKVRQGKARYAPEPTPEPAPQAAKSPGENKSLPPGEDKAKSPGEGKSRTPRRPRGKMRPGKPSAPSGESEAGE